MMMESKSYCEVETQQNHKLIEYASKKEIFLQGVRESVLSKLTA